MSGDREWVEGEEGEDEGSTDPLKRVRAPGRPDLMVARKGSVSHL
jgi:hypothetical protein